MNFIQFKIGGKPRGFKLGLGFLGDVLNHYDTDLQGFGRMAVRNPFSLTPAILYYAHKHECIRKGKPIDFELHDVEDWIEEMPKTLSNPDIEKLMILMMESIKKHLPQLDELPKSKKK
jgi:hypothetical protein